MPERVWICFRFFPGENIEKMHLTVKSQTSMTGERSSC